MRKPLAIDLFCGLGGWAEGFLAEGYDVIGFDIEQRPYPGQLVLQDVLTLHGRQFKDAAVIVGSSPCQEFSYRAMPWKRAKALPPPFVGIALFETQFRIQRQACEAAGRYIPLVAENVVGAQKWVGRAAWHYGSYYLWGDVPALMPTVQKGAQKGGGDWFNDPHNPFRYFKQSGTPGAAWFDKGVAAYSSQSEARKAASAAIAKIPFELAQHIAQCFKPSPAPDRRPNGNARTPQEPAVTPSPTRSTPKTAVARF